MELIVGEFDHAPPFYIVQRTQNSWVGVIMHGGLNGPGFLAISFGLI